MERKCAGAKIVYSLIALCLFGLLFAVTFPIRNRAAKTRMPQLVVMGDSITGECRDQDSIPARLGKKLGLKSLNAAFGGTSMTRVNAERRLDDNRDGLSLASLSKAVAAQDFGVQQMVHITEGGTGFFDSAINKLDKTDFSKMEILILEYGLNDYHNAVPMDNPDNPYDEYTFLGAMRSAVRTLRSAYPDVRIVMVTSTYTWYVEKKLTCEEYDTGNGFLEDYVSAQLRTAEELQLEIVDLYHDFYPHKKFRDWKKYTRDGIHPNEKGRKKIAKKLAEYLKGEGEE